MFNIDKNDQLERDLNFLYRADNEHLQAIKQPASMMDSSSKIEDNFRRLTMPGANALNTTITAATLTSTLAAYSDQQFDSPNYFADKNDTIHDRIDQIVAHINLGSMFFGIIGNLMCISVLVQKPLLNRKFNWYLLLLAIADLFFSIIVFFNYYIVLNNPITALYDLSRITCYFTDYIVSCIDSFCVFLTLILSMDRLYAIKKPIKSKMFFTYRFPKRIAIIGYVSLLVIRSPELIFNQREYISAEMAAAAAAEAANRSNLTWDSSNSPGGYCAKAFDTNGENKNVIIYIYYCNIIIPLLLNIIPAFIIIGLNSALWFFIRHYTRISADYKLGTSLSTSFKVNHFNESSTTTTTTSRRKSAKSKQTTRRLGSSAESSMTTSFTYIQRFCKNRVTKTQKSYYLTIIMLGLWLLLTTIPYYTFFTYYWVTTLKRIENQQRLLLTMQGISSAFFNSNHCINIIIYFLFHKDFRSNAFSLFIKLFNLNPIVKMNPLFFNNNNSSVSNKNRAETTCDVLNRRGAKKSMPELDSTYRTLLRMNLKRMSKMNEETNGIAAAGLANGAGLLCENNLKRIRLSDVDALKLVAAKPSSSAAGRASITSDFNDEDVNLKQTWHNTGDKYMKNVNLIYSYSSTHLNNSKPNRDNSNLDLTTATNTNSHNATGEFQKTNSFESTSNEHINKDYECSTNTTNRSDSGNRALRIKCLDSYNATYQSYMDLNVKEQNSRKLFIPNEKFLKIFRSRQPHNQRTDGKISLPVTGNDISPDSNSPCKTNKKSFAGHDGGGENGFDFSINAMGQHHRHDKNKTRRKFFSITNLF